MLPLEYVELNEKKGHQYEECNLRRAFQTLTIIINVPAGFLLEFK